MFAEVMFAEAEQHSDFAFTLRKILEVPPDLRSSIAQSFPDA